MHRKLSCLLAILTIIILFGFPKAGFYFDDVPMTFGYMLLAATAFAELVCLAYRRSAKIDIRYIWLGVVLLNLALFEAFTFYMYGARSLGAMVSIIVSTLLIPVVVLLGAHWMMRVLGTDRVVRTLRWALIPVFVFGIASFLIYNLTGNIIGIPFVTTTGADISMVTARHNLRGPIVKMFSTYNNGNILGINLLLWGPIAAIASVRCAVGYRSLCILTLSRSVWVGLICLEFFRSIIERSYARLYRSFIAVALLLVAVVLASMMIGRDPTTFLLDKDLGGRMSRLQYDLEASDTISSRRIAWDSESVPAAAWLAFGPIGLALMGIAWSLPIVSGGRSELQKTARLVMVTYLLVAAVEGAFILVPTQAIYWFVAAMAMRDPDVEDRDDQESEYEILEQIETVSKRHINLPSHVVLPPSSLPQTQTGQLS